MGLTCPVVREAQICSSLVKISTKYFHLYRFMLIRKAHFVDVILCLREQFGGQ